MDKDAALNRLTVLEFTYSTIQADIENVAIAAREAGATWAQIGYRLGITKQRAQQRYGAGVAAKRDTSNDHLYSPEDNAEADKALAIMQAIAARQDTPEPSKILATDVAGDSITSSIFLDPIAPAKAPAKKTRTPKFAKAYGDEYPKTRPVYTLPGEAPATAQPGTGKGPHQCPSCGDTNHHGPKRGQVAMFEDCVPTKYDPPATADYMNAR